MTRAVRIFLINRKGALEESAARGHGAHHERSLDYKIVPELFSTLVRQGPHESDKCAPRPKPVTRHARPLA